MKQNCLALLTLSTCILLSSCSAGSSECSSSSYAMPESAISTTATSDESAPQSDYATNTGGDISRYADGLKLVYNGSLILETTEFDPVAQGLRDLVTKYQGYFSNSSISQFQNNYRYGEYTIRIPTEHYDAFHQEVSELSLVTRDRTTVEDISATYYDTQGRLETQQIKLDRLQALLDQAENMEDLITIEAAISDTQWQIDNLSGDMNYFDSIVDYATIDITLEEVYQLSNVQDAPKTFGQRIGNSIIEGTDEFAQNLEDLAVACAYHWLSLLLVFVGAVVIFKVRPSIKKNKRSFFSKKKGSVDDIENTEK